MKSILRLATVFAVIALSLGIVHASDQIAVYALIDKVVLEPNADHPERIQISGVFAIAKLNHPNYYEAPQRGTLYFQLPKDKPDLARKEWTDLSRIAGTRQVVAFGSRHQLKPRVRKPGEKPDGPEVYEVGAGVVKVRTDTAYGPIKSLLEYSAR